MSFGKDQQHTQNIPGYGAGSFAQKTATASRRGSRRGGEPYWTGCFQLSEHTPDTFRLLRGDYTQDVYDGEANTIYPDTLPYVLVVEHYHAATRRGAICTGGPAWRSRDLRRPCEGCEMYWSDVMERKAKKTRGDTSRGPNRLSAREQYAFSIWDYGLYFEIPQVDKQGQIRMNQKTNQPYTEWVKGSSNDPRYQGRPWKQGHLLPWAMGVTYKDTLLQYNKVIRNSCTSCGNQNCVVSHGWFCRNPQCRQPIFDPNNTTLTPEQQDQITNFPHQCPHCGQKLYPEENISCTACQTPVRGSIFDVDIQAMRQGSAGQQTFLNIMSYSNPRSIQVSDQEVLKNIKPLDLLKKFATTPIERQRSIWNLQSAQQPAQAPPQPAPQAPPGQPQWQPPPGIAPSMPMNQMGQPVSPGGQPVYIPPPQPGQVAPPQAPPPPMGMPVAMPPQPPPMPPVPQTIAQPMMPPPPPQPPPPAVAPPMATPGAAPVQDGGNLSQALVALNKSMGQ